MNVQNDQERTARRDEIRTFAMIGLLVLAIVLLFTACKHELPVLPETTADNGSGGGGDPFLPCDPDSVYFQQDVLPLLVSSCAIPGCHDAITHEDGIRMYSYTFIMEEVDAGDPYSSELIEVVTENDPDDIMPPAPHEPLTPEQIQLLVTWIEQGAQDNGCVGGCDTLNVTYSSSIAPLLANSCTGCHSGSSPQGNIDLTTWPAVNVVALDGRLAGAIQHQSGYTAMPPAGGMLPQCAIDNVLTWIQDGAPNN